MILLGAVFVIAIVVSVLGFVPALLPGKAFFAIYSITIGVAFLLIQAALGCRVPFAHFFWFGGFKVFAFLGSTLSAINVEDGPRCEAIQHQEECCLGNILSTSCSPNR